jgi:hypothetical protein
MECTGGKMIAINRWIRASAAVPLLLALVTQGCDRTTQQATIRGTGQGNATTLEAFNGQPSPGDDNVQARKQGGQKSLVVRFEGTRDRAESAFFEHQQPGRNIVFNLPELPPETPDFTATFQLRGVQWSIGPVSLFNSTSPAIPINSDRVFVRLRLSVIAPERPDLTRDAIFSSIGGVALRREASQAPIMGGPGDTLQATVRLRAGLNYTIRVFLDGQALISATTGDNYSLQGSVTYDSLVVYREP